MREVAGLLLTALVASAMAVVGYQLMFRQWSFCLVPASLLLWLPLSFVLRERDYVTAAGWGLLSPLLGSMLVAGPVGPFVALALGHMAFPVGLVTGLLVKACLSACEDGAD